MARPHFTEEFKIDAVKQVTERGYSVAEVSKRLGVSPHSLYQWRKRLYKSLLLTTKQLSKRLGLVD